MEVQKRTKNLTAYVFKRVADSEDGTNFKELEQEAREDGGGVNRLADDLVIVNVNGSGFTLPLGFAVIPSQAGKIVSVDVFEREYTSTVAGTNDNLTGLLERVDRIEKELSELNKQVAKKQKSDRNT